MDNRVAKSVNLNGAVRASNLVSVLESWNDKNSRELQICTPAIVHAYNRLAGTAIVVPLVEDVTNIGDIIKNVPIKVSVKREQHGGFLIDAPLFEGDTGWLISGDKESFTARSRNAFIQEKDTGIGKKSDGGEPDGNQGPQTLTTGVLHSFKNGYFVPDKWGGILLPDEFKDSLVIQQLTKDSDSHGRIVMDPDGTIHLLSTRWQKKD